MDIYCRDLLGLQRILMLLWLHSEAVPGLKIQSLLFLLSFFGATLFIPGRLVCCELGPFIRWMIFCHKWSTLLYYRKVRMLHLSVCVFVHACLGLLAVQNVGSYEASSHMWNDMTHILYTNFETENDIHNSHTPIRLSMMTPNKIYMHIQNYLLADW